LNATIILNEVLGGKEIKVYRNVKTVSFLRRAKKQETEEGSN
jgi:hypothetical protein